MEEATETLHQLAAFLRAHEGIRTAQYSALEADLPGHVGNMLRRSRSDRGWSQRCAAQQLHISRAQYLRYESGIAMPRLHTISLWSLIFGAPPSVLLSPSRYGQSERAIPPHFFRLSQWLCESPTLVFCDTLQQIQRLLDLPELLPDPASCCLDDHLLEEARAEVMSHNLYLTVGANLRLVRQMLNYSQEEMANGLGISTSHYLSIERGDVTYSFAMLPRFSYAMQLPPLALAINTRYYAARQALSTRYNATLNLFECVADDLKESVLDHIVGTMALYRLSQR